MWNFNILTIVLFMLFYREIYGAAEGTGGTGDPLRCPNNTKQECEVGYSCTMNDKYSDGTCVEDWEKNKCCVQCLLEMALYCESKSASACVMGVCTPCSSQDGKSCYQFMNMPICHPTEYKCVPCSKLEKCAGFLKDNKHECDAGRCIECKDDSHCATKFSDKPIKYQCTKKGKCSECLTDEDCGNEYKSKMKAHAAGSTSTVDYNKDLVCNNYDGKCEECYNYPKNGIFNHGCFDPEGVKPDVNNSCIEGKCQACKTDVMCNRPRTTCTNGVCKYKNYVTKMEGCGWLMLSCSIIAAMLTRD